MEPKVESGQTACTTQEYNPAAYIEVSGKSVSTEAVPQN